jgi:hypothetical protein
MKNDFQRAAAKIRLFEEQATVVTVSFNKANVKKTINDVVVQDEKLVPSDVQNSFLSFLNNRSLKHEVIVRDKNTLIFAVAKENYYEIGKAMDDFFSGNYSLARGFTCIAQSSFDTIADLKNDLLKPFSRTRREVSKAVAKL